MAVVLNITGVRQSSPTVSPAQGFHLTWDWAGVTHRDCGQGSRLGVEKEGRWLTTEQPGTNGLLGLNGHTKGMWSSYLRYQGEGHRPLSGYVASS